MAVVGLTRLLVVNAGSSSTRLTILGPDDGVEESLHLPPAGNDEAEAALDALIARARPQASVHRIVHGGPWFTGAVLVDASTEDRLRALGELAPLHVPPALRLVDQVRAAMPDRPAVACFDTGFFADLPDETATYPLPSEWRAHWSIRRYGFHGLSHAWVASQLDRVLAGTADTAGTAGTARTAGTATPGDRTRVVSAHLGAGASLAALHGGRPVDTTMGFTPLDGLVMATRPGSVDPGILVHLLRVGEVTLEQLEDGLEHHSGLVALAGNADLARVIERAGAGDATASLAYRVMLHRLRAGIAAMAASLGGIDALVFTGGAGEASSQLRADTCAGLDFLGIDLDERANTDLQGEGVVSAGGPVTVAVVRAREDLEMSRQARALLDRTG